MNVYGVITWCNRFIKSGFFLLFALVPLLLTPWNYELFEYNKMMAVYGLTAIIAGAWLTKILIQQELKIRRTPLDIPIILFALSQLISSLFSLDPHVSWFGYYSRFNGGMWSVLSYVILYYAFVSNTDAFTGLPPQTKELKEKSKATALLLSSLISLLQASLITAALVAAYGVLEHFGIDRHIWVQDVQNRVFSTLGQPNWLAAYLIALIPLSTAFFLSGWQAYVQNKSHRIGDFVFGIWGIITALFFLVLLYTRSRSGLVALAIADIVFWGITLFSWHKERTTITKRVMLPMIVIHLAFGTIIFFNGSYIPQIDKYVTLAGWKTLLRPASRDFEGQAATPPTGYTAPVLESGGTESGTIRKYVWQAALLAWKSSTKAILIGTGTESFAFAFYQYRPVGHNMTSEWDFLYNKAHNEYLNFLATTGILGLGSYLLIISIFVMWFLKIQMTKPKDQINVKAQMTKSLDLGLDLTFEPWILSLALFAGWSSVIVTNFFGFSVVVTQLILFLFPAIAYTISQRTDVSLRRMPIVLPRWAAWLPVIIVLWVITMLSSLWYADKQFAKGYQSDRAGLYGQATPLLIAAIAINPREPLYHDEIAAAYAALSVASFGAKNATQAAQLAGLALSESDKALHISPNNVNFLKSRTKVYYTLSALDPSFNAAAINALTQAVKLSPNDPKIYYNLAILSGRENQNDQAVTYLLKAKELKPDYRDVYNALTIFYTEAGKKDAARAILQEYLNKINPADAQFQEMLKK